MKNNYLLALLLCAFVASAQTPETDAIAEAEMKSADVFSTIAVNPNTANYDITYHKLEFTVDPAAYFIAGKVTTTYTALANMNTVTFDMMDDLVVTSVKRNNVALAFSQDADELVINLPATQTIGTAATVEIIYSGAPTPSGFGSFVTTTHSGVPVLWTLSEPFGAREWWPCKQDLNDKVNSIDVYITAPSEYTAVANGLEQGQVQNGNGTKTTHFHHGYPIPAYLIAMAVTNYEVYTIQAGLGTAESPFFPIVNYMFPETAPANQASVNVTPSIMNFFESKFGPYPYRDEKYGHAQFQWGGGMEHTTVSFMTAGQSGAYSRSLIAHELGHQWFGDKVTCGSWRDIWLNEGFATYMATMVVEEFDGNAAYVADKNSMINNITGAPNGAVYLTEAEATDINRIFSSRLSYNKGAMVLNMLRFKLGDEDFFQGLQNYLNDTDLAYAFAHTPDLQSHLEATSGMDLNEFFNDWVYKQGYPTFTITGQNIGPGQARIVVNQSQSHISVGFFEMPIPVRVFGAGGQQFDLVLENNIDNQTFIVNVPFPINGLAFDPNRDIISKNNTTTLDTETFDLADAIVLSPNPAADVLAVSLPESLVLKGARIYNMLGQTVLESATETTWDVSKLSPGVHFISLETDAGTKKIKFIKE